MSKLNFLDLEITGTNPVMDHITDVGIGMVTLEAGQLSRW